VGRSSGRSSGTLFRDDPSFFVAENPRFSRKNTENRTFSENFADKIGFTRVFTENVRKKSQFFREKMTFFREKKNIIDFSEKSRKRPKDALCVENTQRASKTLFAWDAPSFFVAENPRFSRKNTENRTFSENFADKIGFTLVFMEKVRKKSQFFREKMAFFLEKKKLSIFRKSPESVQKTLFAWDAPRDALLGS